ncbi:hypothetical protein AGMMS49949_09050 [Alphaproteobacteria bacterium]|nr:hypothetical protein AGMMS49949_09050 [Alphaproteobacteria bacterium]GHT00302.1 hypothetical protein AGMMS50296_8600 [Alphaproteobacteria bacterium]
MNPTPEQNLWQGVVTQAIRDAFSTSEPYAQRQAWAWFYSNSGDYRSVCIMAGIMPEKLRKALIEKVFFTHLLQKGELKMKDLNIPKTTSLHEESRLAQEFILARKTKALFRALYSQQELDKEIGKLNLQDIINICRQSEIEEQELLNLEG